MLQRAAIDFKSEDLRKKPSSPLSSTFAYIVVNKKLFLGDLRKRLRLNVKPRNYVKLIIPNQDWDPIHSSRLRLSIKTSIVEKAVKVKD